MLPEVEAEKLESEAFVNILIVEDEVRLADALTQILEDNNYHVDAVYDGRSGLEYLLSDYYDVAVIDVMLPLINGYELVREARSQGIATPLLMLTARTQLADKVNGLDSGADDYMTKPFQPEELLARLRALTRRKGDVVLDEVSYGDLVLDLTSNYLRCGNRDVHLSFKEFEVMKILATNPEQVIPKETLLSKIWGIESNAEDNNVEAYISFLRKKLSYLHSDTEITTLRKVGYRLSCKEKE